MTALDEPTIATRPTVGLEVRRLRVRAGRRTVVDGIDLEVGAGEWIGLIGPNGAGKTSLLRALAGVAGIEGSIEVVTPSGGRRPPVRTDVALVPQTPLVPPGMTVAEYVTLGRTAHLGWFEGESRADRQVVAAVLGELGLAHLAGRMLDSLSGGEAQRAVVARALAQQTPVVLLDESTSNLDVGHTEALLRFVDDRRRETGLTVIAAFHDLTTAARFADRLVLLAGGELVADGSPVEVLDADLLSSVYGVALTVERVGGDLVVLPRRG